MYTAEDYDARIARILSKLDAIKEREFSFPCGKWPPVWKPPMSEKQVAAFEAEKKILLPPDYRRFLTTVASAGSQPFYGLCPLRQKENVVEQPFPYTLDHIIYFLHMTEEEMEDFYDDESHPFTADHGILTLCTEGCGMDSVLVVNSEDPNTYGTVWYSDFANDFGMAPMYNPETGEPFHFLDWLEYWVDRETALGDDEFFSFGETLRIPDPPDNPDILGRKMGWIS